jgi:hypothetical protein
MDFETLSDRVLVRSEAAAVEPERVIRKALAGVVERLGPARVGHAKAIGYFENGRLYVSATGPNRIEAIPFGDVPSAVTEFLLDLTCIFGATPQDELERAYRGSLDDLAEDPGVRFAKAPAASVDTRRRSTRMQGRLPGDASEMTSDAEL